MKHSFLYILLIFLTALPVRADIVTGRFVDATTGEPLPDLESTAYSRPNEFSLTYHSFTADSLGCFSFSMSGDDCWIEASYIGYHPRRVHFSAFEGNDTLRLGDIALKPSEVFLRSAVVTARAKRFVMRGDTVVFNPDAFNLSEGARLDELIKQLPGVTEKDGKLFWMDKPVRILVNGEEMFADNTILQERLPAEAVERIKAYNKASKLKEHTGRDDGAEDHVLDIQVKPGFLEKWYGSAKGTYQTDDGYLARLDAMYLSTSDPLMAYGNVNNINQQILSKTFRSMGSGSSSPFGKQQFGSLGYKHQWKTRQGEKELDQSFSFNVQGQHTDGWGSSRQRRETFLSSGGRTYGLTDSKEYSHLLKPDFSFLGNFQVDSITWLYVRGGWNYEKKREEQTERSAAYDAAPYDFTRNPLDAAFATDHPGQEAGMPVSRSLYRSTSFSEKMNSNVSVELLRLLPGDAKLRVEGGINYTDQQTETYAERDLRYFRDDLPGEWRYETDDRPGHSLRATADASYQRWLWKPLMINVGYHFQHRHDYERQDHTVTDAAAAPDAEQPDPLLDPNSYRNRKTTDEHRASMGLTLNVGKLSVLPNLNYTFRHENLAYMRGTLDIDKLRDVDLWQPDLTLRWKVRRGQSLEAAYHYSTSVPDLLETVAYTDNTNPLFVIQGNPLLKNSHTHSASINYFLNMTQQQRSISAGVNYERWMSQRGYMFFFNDRTGAYRQMSANLRDGWGLSGKLRYEQGVGDFVRVHNSIEAGYHNNYGFLTADYDADQAGQQLRKRFFLTENPSVTLSREELTLMLSGRYTLSRLRYELTPQNNQTLTDYIVYGMARYKWRDWTVETSLNLQGYKGYSSPEMNRAIPNWKILVGRKVLKGKGRIDLSFDDLLNKRRSYFSTESATERTEYSSDLMHHYVQLSFTYNFEAKDDKKNKRR